MKYQEYIVKAIESAADEFFKGARAVPADKLEWSPLESGRSVLDLCREIAMTPTWGAEVTQGVASDYSEEAMAAIKVEQSAWTTIDDCQTQFDQRMARLREVYAAISDEGLAVTRWLPYDGGRDFTVKEMMDYPRWNLNYHWGQVAYIQTLYGDKEMH